jgi:cobalamin biosynthesis protein CobT
LPAKTEEFDVFMKRIAPRSAEYTKLMRQLSNRIYRFSSANTQGDFFFASREEDVDFQDSSSIKRLIELFVRENYDDGTTVQDIVRMYSPHFHKHKNNVRASELLKKGKDENEENQEEGGDDESEESEESEEDEESEESEDKEDQENERESVHPKLKELFLNLIMPMMKDSQRERMECDPT